MSVSKCMQNIPGTMWRWRASLLFAGLLSLALLTYLSSASDLRLSRVLSDDALSRRHPRNVDEWNRRAATIRDRRRATAPAWKQSAVAAPQHQAWQEAPAPREPPRRLYVPRRRVVHFDLKGAPPTVEYFISLLPLIQRLGGTDLLIEWEDMFPFWGALRPAAARNHYSRADVRRMLDEARRHQLRVIPLVQTFGHLEPFLKLAAFAHLREAPEQPTAICPSRNESLRLVELMVDQVMELHRDAQFLHIGCDEVYHMGLCDLCQRKLRDSLYLDHVVRVAQYVRAKHSVTPLIWDDMMRHMAVDQLQQSGIGQLVEPMVWVYAENVYRFVGPHVYQIFAQVFPRVWGASAYKGAFGETLTTPPLQRHLENTINWLDVMQREGGGFREGFSGLVLTGWQRYDHMAVLCEILPSAVPSLALTLITASHGFFNSSLHWRLYEELGCTSTPRDRQINLDGDPSGFMTFSSCTFPGNAFFSFLSQLSTTLTQTEEAFTTAQSKGWLTEYNINRNYTNPFRVDEVMDAFYGVQYSLMAAVSSAREALEGVVDRYTIAEWVEQKILPWLRRLSALRRRGESLKRRSVWRRRPLPMLGELERYGLNVTEPRLRPAAAVVAHQPARPLSEADPGRRRH